jgi:DNA-binding transcriptional ArsR family regulator
MKEPIQTIEHGKIDRACQCLKALAHPLRLQILCALREGEKNVQQLERLLGATQANMSQHLGVLRDKEILTSRKEANQVFYSVKDARTFQLLGLMQAIYCKS